MMQLHNTAHAAKYDHIWQHHKAIFDYVMIEAGCLDNPGVCIKGVLISEGPLYYHVVLLQLTDIMVHDAHCGFRWINNNPVWINNCNCVW